MGWRVNGTGVNGRGTLTCAAAAVIAASRSTDATRMAVCISLRRDTVVRRVP
jgi:hypothetical protein